jgi:hypothetical protein
MFAANPYVVRAAAAADELALRRLAELDSQSPSGRVPVGELPNLRDRLLAALRRPEADNQQEEA